MSGTLKSIAYKFFPFIGLHPRKLRQKLPEDISRFTDKCIEFLDWHGPGERLSVELDDGLFYSYDKSEVKDISCAIHNVMREGRIRTIANIKYFAVSGGGFLKALPTMLMANLFLSKPSKKKAA